MANSRKESSDCPVEAGLAVLGGRWKARILWVLWESGPSRYAQLRRAVDGITEKMLIQQLRELEHDGVIRRRNLGGVPPRVEYALTELGESLDPVMQALTEWGLAQQRRQVAAPQE